jgi:hypothetical protein
LSVVCCGQRTRLFRPRERLRRTKEKPMSNKYLGIYLNDHLAMFSANHELVERSLASNEGSDLGKALRELLASLEEDRRTLESLMAEREVTPSRVKEAGAWLAERVGRLKLNGQITGYSPLSRLVEVEGIGLALEAKRAFWSTLSEVGIQQAGGADTAELAARTKEWIDRLQPHLRAAGREALGSHAPAGS